MSKIQFEQISEDLIEIAIPPETPIAMVQQLTKSLTGRGLVEDVVNSTLSVRYFYRPEDKINDLADKLIKSLEKISGTDLSKVRTPMDEMRFETQRKNRELDIAERRRKAGINTAQIKPNIPSPTGPNTLPGVPNKLVGEIGSNKTFKNEDEDEDNIDIEKSNYGPKNAGLYNPADNARRKSNNLDPVGIGPNVNAKAYSSKPGQMSAKASADLTARIQAKANKKQPVKIYSPEEKAALASKMKLNKNWGQHLPFPSAEEEIMRLAKNEPIQHGEEAAANQLASLMAGKSMLGDNVPAAIKARFSAPVAQPTNEQLFGHLEVTEEMAKAAEQQWNKGAFGWLQEAQKPISQKFNSEEEELAYWNSIKVSDRDDGQSGY